MASSFSAQASTAAPPSRFFNGVEYARVGNVILRLDACIPEGARNAPAVIIVHGGGWVAGDRRANVLPLFEPLSQGGFAWFSISYRFATDVTQFGAGIDDVLSAIEFVRSHASQYAIDPKRIALLGESAGGQLAAMAALRLPETRPVQAVVALYAPTNLAGLAQNSNYIPRAIRDSVRGTPFESFLLAGLTRLSPLHHVRRTMPPFLLIHGTADSLVPFQQSVEMCNRMRQAGASCEVLPVSGGGHGIRWWEADPAMALSYKTKMIAWLKRELCAIPAR